MNDYRERFRERFAGEDGLYVFSSRDENILAFIEEVVAEERTIANMSPVSGYKIGLEESRAELRTTANISEVAEYRKGFSDGRAEERKELIEKVEGMKKHMVSRFLGWKLPKNFRPDAGISFEPEFNREYMAKQGKPPMRHEPVGTNLFNATQAKEMVEYMLKSSYLLTYLRSEVPIGTSCISEETHRETPQPIGTSRSGEEPKAITGGVIGNGIPKWPRPEDKEIAPGLYEATHDHRLNSEFPKETECYCDKNLNYTCHVCHTSKETSSHKQCPQAPGLAPKWVKGQEEKKQNLCHWCEQRDNPTGFARLASCPIHDPTPV